MTHELLDCPISELVDDPRRLDLGAVVELGDWAFPDPQLPIGLRVELFEVMLRAEEVSTAEFVEAYCRRHDGLDVVAMKYGALAQVMVSWLPEAHLSEHALTSWERLFGLDGPPTCELIPVEDSDYFEFDQAYFQIEVCGWRIDKPFPLEGCDGTGGLDRATMDKLGSTEHRWAYIPGSGSSRRSAEFLLESYRGVGFFSEWKKTVVSDLLDGLTAPGATRRPFLVEDLEDAACRVRDPVPVNALIPEDAPMRAEYRRPWAPTIAERHKGFRVQRTLDATLWLIRGIGGSPTINHPKGSPKEELDAHPDEMAWLWRTKSPDAAP